MELFYKVDITGKVCMASKYAAVIITFYVHWNDVY